MRRALLKAVTAAAAVALAASAQAQEPQFIEAGKTVTVKAGKAGEPDIYSFLGISGSRVTISLNIAGNALLTLYTPRGEEMLHASGTNTVRLEAVLPLHNIFLIGVSREDSMKGYTLSLSATEPDVHEMYFAEGTGFRMPDFDRAAPLDFGRSPGTSSCWIEPGSKVRVRPNKHPKNITEITLARNGHWYYKIMPAGKPVAYNESWFDDASEVIDKIGVSEVERLGPYQGYLCD